MSNYPDVNQDEQTAKIGKLHRKKRFSERDLFQILRCSDPRETNIIRGRSLQSLVPEDQ
jgi:hypothetical protein